MMCVARGRSLRDFWSDGAVLGSMTPTALDRVQQPRLTNGTTTLSACLLIACPSLSAAGAFVRHAAHAFARNPGGEKPFLSHSLGARGQGAAIPVSPSPVRWRVRAGYHNLANSSPGASHGSTVSPRVFKITWFVPYAVLPRFRSTVRVISGRSQIVPHKGALEGRSQICGLCGTLGCCVSCGGAPVAGFVCSLSCASGQGPCARGASATTRR
jgi:hypothetical protein